MPINQHLIQRCLMIALILLLVGCAGDNPEATPIDSVALLIEASNNIRSKDTFRLYVEQSGAEYLIPVYLFNNELVNVEFRFARAQYVAPDTLQATSRVIAVMPLDVEVLARGNEQWYQLPGLGWQKGEFAPSFNPATLISDDSGFQAALTALKQLEYLGETTLDDGRPVYHLRGIADGPAVANLVVGLLDLQGDIPVEVFIHREERYPVRLKLIQPDTVSETEPVPTTWTIDVFDVNAPSEIITPEQMGLEQTTTPEVTATDEP
ncbi:MAG: LppX_LprAFG lipoprotein [Anaerolineae bacterium]|jgi:hypothetical protein|nr:LppX_LprAFG lipoprotein [Anaerolineae bacterium]